jgi:IS5 family transposase
VNPYDGHALATVIPDMERTIGSGINRILPDAGYRGQNAPLSHRFGVFTSGQKRPVTPAIKREMRRRSTVEPVIGHIKTGHRLDLNYRASPQGDAINAVLAATGYNLRLLLNWLRLLLCVIARLILPRSSSAHRPQIA